jgi:hypothetical protein
VDYDLINEIILSKSKKYNIKSNDNKINMHLRIGDSIKDYKNGKFIYILNSSGKSYCTKIETIERFAPLLKNLNKEIVLFYGQHVLSNNYHNLTSLYINKVKYILKKNNIKSGGGYSWIISNIVKKNNNIVIELDDTKNYLTFK